ncbi:MAG: hypothetical protein IPG32_19295 [Saprospirales bacterium]|nr:hypothetical protein [Saprospirales bacterium]
MLFPLLACAFAGLCYAEFASMIPFTVYSAYNLPYATLGEFLAWIIGWDLILNSLLPPPPFRSDGRAIW